MKNKEKKIEKRSIVFGRVVIDLQHRFFGESAPSAFVIADMWTSEDGDGEDAEVWCDHYRGHVRFSYKALRDADRFYITDCIVDCNKNVLEQVEAVESSYIKEAK